jgi:hypothetical protein
MSTDADRISKIAKQAAEIAKDLPENLQEAAFNRAFDALSQSSAEPALGGQPGGKRRRGEGRARTAAPAAKPASSDPAEVLIAELNRTAHPEIMNASRNLDRALHLLRIAERDFGIKGLTAMQMAKVLTEKFRHATSHQAIRQALNTAGNYTDYVPQAGGATVYRLMAPGERYLDHGESSVKKDARTPRSAAPKPRRRSARKPKQTKEGNRTAGRKRAGQGPKPMIEELIKEGFFKSPKGISDIKQRLRDKKGVAFKATDLSPTLVRLLRQNALDRERNDSNQFEYSVPA